MVRTRNSALVRKVRYAVVGLGYIAQVAVLPGFRHARGNSVLTGLVSDDPVKIQKLGRMYGVEHAWSYDDYDACLASGLVDAVYIALPNAMHEEYAVRAARAGIHVLCEKPLAMTEKECERMIAAADDAGVRLMTAYRLHFEDANTRAIEIANSGRIGEPRLFESVFTMQVRDPDNIRLDEERGGGTLYDIGIYCINAMRYLFRAEPIQVTAMSANGIGPRFSEVEEMCAATLRFPGERLGSFICSFGAGDVSSYRIVGTKGDLRVEPAYDFANGLCHHVTVGGRTSRRVFAKRDQFAPELIHFSKCIQEGEEPEPSGREGLADVRIIRALYASAERGGQPVDLAPFERSERPSPKNELRKPAVAKPGLVHARSPSGRS